MDTGIITAAGPSTRSPSLTVVVVVLAGRDSLGRCLRALTGQDGLRNAEIIVPHDEVHGEVSVLQGEFPGVQFLGVKGRRTYAELRTLGVRQARGTIVALTEDHCIPDPDWCARILEAHAARHAAVGGAVEKEAPDTVLNWAMYLCDYGRYMNPVPEGPAKNLTDCNVSYERAALDAIADVWAGEFHEPEVHGALHGRGGSLWLSPRIVVRQQRSVHLREALWDRYAFGRLFACTRVAAMSALRRGLYATCAFVIPPLLVGRIAVNVLRKGRCVTEFVRALPVLLILASVWALGECTGYLTGTPTPSLSPAFRRADPRAERGRRAVA